MTSRDATTQAQHSMSATPRGVRNNNPGNIRHSGISWQGQAAQQTDPAFVTFASVHDGIRAIARILISYQARHHLATTAELIHRWAPPHENLTGAYAAAVARAIGRDPTSPIDLVHDPALLARFVAAIIHHENGDPRRHGRDRWYDAALIQRAIHAALQGSVQHHEDRSHQHRTRHHRSLPHPRPTPTPNASPPTIAPRMLG